MPDLLLLEFIVGMAFVPLLVTFLWLAVSILVGRRPREIFVVRNSQIAIGLAFLSAVLLVVLQPQSQNSAVIFGSWFGEGHYHFDIAVQIDMLAICYALFSLTLLYLICTFSQRYLHREPGFYRFYLVLLIFALGLLLVSFSGTLELLLVGWEIVGLSSIMLIAFFTQRPQPPQNGLWVFSVYRITDIGLYAAILYLHWSGATTLFESQENALWSGIQSHDNVEITALLLIVAVMGKAALFPFSGWLPRAMEGPTPSSAVFYGALSVHLGPFLLLRMSDLISSSTMIGAILILVGALTVVVGNLAGRVQSDIKSRLSFGAVSQLGFITVEIGLGWYGLALVHVITHAIFRTLQFLRAPSLLHERHHLEQMLGHHIGLSVSETNAVKNGKMYRFRFGLDRGFLDVILGDWVVNNILSAVRRIDYLERKFTNWVANEKQPNPSVSPEGGSSLGAPTNG